MKVFFKTKCITIIFICNLNNLKVMDDLYSQYLIETLSKIISKSYFFRDPVKMQILTYMSAHSHTLPNFGYDYTYHG